MEKNLLFFTLLHLHIYIYRFFPKINNQSIENDTMQRKEYRQAQSQRNQTLYRDQVAAEPVVNLLEPHYSQRGADYGTNHPLSEQHAPNREGWSGVGRRGGGNQEAKQEKHGRQELSPFASPPVGGAGAGQAGSRPRKGGRAQRQSPRRGFEGGQERGKRLAGNSRMVGRLQSQTRNDEESDEEDHGFAPGEGDSESEGEDEDIFGEAKAPPKRQKAMTRAGKTHQRGRARPGNGKHAEDGGQDDDSWGLSQSPVNVTNQQLLSEDVEVEELPYRSKPQAEELRVRKKLNQAVAETSARAGRSRKDGGKHKQHLQYVADPYAGEDKTAQLNMVLCHAVASDDELAFVKTMRKLGQLLRRDPQERIAARALRLFSGKPFMEVRLLGPVKRMRECMNEALWFAIKACRETIAFDLILFAKDSAFSLTITEVELQLLVKGEMWELIEDLVRTNAFLSIDESKVAGADLFAVQQIKERRSKLESASGQSQDRGADVHDFVQTAGPVSSRNQQKAMADPKGRGRYEPNESSEIHSRAKDSNGQPDEYFEGGNDLINGVTAVAAQEITDTAAIPRSQTEIIAQGPPPLPSTTATEQIREAHNIARGQPRRVLESAQSSQRVVTSSLEGTMEDKTNTGGGQQQRVELDNEKDVDLEEVLKDLDLAPDQPNKENESGQKYDSDLQFRAQSLQKPSFSVTTGLNAQKSSLTTKSNQSMKTPAGRPDELQAQQSGLKLSTVPEIAGAGTMGEGESSWPPSRNRASSTVTVSDPALKAIGQTEGEAKPKLVEKYLKISDFLEYICENKDVFIGEMLHKVKNKEEEESILMDFLKTFMLNVQDVIDFDRSLKLLIENKLHKMLVDELFEQTDASVKSNEPEIDLARSTEFVSARHKVIPDGLRELFRKFARVRLLVQLINQSVLSYRYHIAYEVTKRFLGDLLKTKYLPIFDSIFTHCEEYTTCYEAKIAVLLNCIPLMNRKIAARIMKIFESVLNEAASNSVLKKNINPLRVGLMLYRLIDTIQNTFGYSEHTSKLMKELLSGQMRSVLEMYNDPDELMVLVEQTDYEGNDCFWYLDEYDLYNILDCRIMDRVIQKKWNGKYEINTTDLDYSTAYTLMVDKYQLFATDRVFSELRIQTLNFDRADMVHGYKFHVWKHSMLLRSRIDFVFTLVASFVFQLFQNAYMVHFTVARDATLQIATLKASSSQIGMEKALSDQTEALDNSAYYLGLTRTLCVIHLLFPVNLLMQWFFVRQTKRKYPEPDAAFFTELVLFVVTCKLFADIAEYTPRVEGNGFLRDDLSPSQTLIVNFLWLQETHAYESTIVLAILAMSTWAKLLLRLMVTHSFGPFFKVIAMMLIDLAKFMVLWVIFLFIFASGAAMLFGRIANIRDFYSVFFLFFEYSLGNWDVSQYCGKELPEYYCVLGNVFTGVILLVNMVLLLNLVIAILSSTYAYYEDKKLGLYYEVLVGKFPTMEYDDKYGVVACAQPPLNLMILPFWWVTLLPWSEKQKQACLYEYNQFLCHLLYLPFGLTMVAVFTLRCAIYVPIAYVKHTAALIETLTDSDETMDEFHEKLARFFTIVKFILFGPFILVFAIPIDAGNFFKNLYTKPYVEKFDPSQEAVSQNALDVFESSCKEQLKIQRRQPDCQGSTLVPFVRLNKQLQLKLDIETQIFKLVFDNADGAKFIFDENTKTQKLAPSYLSGLKEFSRLKRLVANSADKSGQVDIHLLLSFTLQVDLRRKMLEIEINAGDLALGSSEEILNRCLYEFTKVEPATVENMLAEEGQVLDTVIEKVNSLNDNLHQIRESMDDRFDLLQKQMAEMHALLLARSNTQPRANGSEGRHTAFTSLVA